MIRNVVLNSMLGSLFVMSAAQLACPCSRASTQGVFLIRAANVLADARMGRTESPNAETGRAISDVMNKSASDWNRGDLAAYASLYKEAPDILLVGPTNVRGFEAALKYFKENYDTPAKRGRLSYSEIAVRQLDSRFATVTGRFHLERTVEGGGDVDGFYLLVFERTGAGWKLIVDDSSVVPKRK